MLREALLGETGWRMMGHLERRLVFCRICSVLSSSSLMLPLLSGTTEGTATELFLVSTFVMMLFLMEL